MFFKIYIKRGGMMVPIEKKVIINFHEPDITPEENARRFEQVRKVVEKIAVDMLKRGITKVEE
ncbi:hypothetical protein [Clostridium butyricum]|nr:hypothetical protein [Clostridium butyricum]NFL30584.1 hypothetical protein [Clostridium butyricum]NFS19538.1 hypothetical protein [Clostridium butyricum]